MNEAMQPARELLVRHLLPALLTSTGQWIVTLRSTQDCQQWRVSGIVWSGEKSIKKKKKKEKIGFVGTCPGIEPGHRFNSRTSTHEANSRTSTHEAIFQNHMKIDGSIQTRHVRNKIKRRLVLPAGTKTKSR